jgi:hypothetical protein
VNVEQDAAQRLVVWVPRSRLVTLAVGFPAACGAALALAYLAWGVGMVRVAGAAAAGLCLALLAVLAGYRSAFVFDAKVRVVQGRSTIFGRALRVRHWPLATVREVEILSSALQPKDRGASPLPTRWYQVRVGDVVVAPMLVGDKGRDAALTLARLIAEHLSLDVAER